MLLQKRRSLLKSFKKQHVQLQVGGVYYLLPLKIAVANRPTAQSKLNQVLTGIPHTFYQPDNFSQIGMLWLGLRYPVSDQLLTQLQTTLTKVTWLQTLWLKPKAGRAFHRLLLTNFLRDRWVIDDQNNDFVRFYAKAHPRQAEFMITLSFAGAGLVLKCHRLADLYLLLNQSGELWRKV